jgi:hypothetical protein
MKEITSEKKDQVLKALMCARKQMGSVKKDSTNPFHKNKYASLPAFIEACDDALTNNGLIIYQCINQEDGKDCLITTLEHPESGQWLRSYATLLNVKGDSQGLGSAITYMRRYTMASLLNLCPDEDDDGQKACAPVPEKKKQTTPSQKISEEQLDELLKLEKFADDSWKKNMKTYLKQTFKIDEYKDMPNTSFEKCMESLKKNTERRQAKAA